MNEYQVYVFDSGHVNATYVVTAVSDSDALEQARHKVPGYHDIQVWQGRRFVGRIQPPSSDD
jgi:hypothetical protein